MTVGEDNPRFMFYIAHDMCDQLHRLISLLAEYIEKCREISVEATQASV
jgi:hypothetical protein